MKFELGRLVGTHDALTAIFDAGQTPRDFIRRHAEGDWGELDEQERNINEIGLRHGYRLLSVYTTKKGVKIWVITEADRSTTTVLLPDEY